MAPAYAVVRIPLGKASAFDQKDFPLAYHDQEGDFNKGSFLIKASLDEMEKIRELGIDLNQNQDFIFDTRLSVEALKAEKERLQDNRKTINPIKTFRNYRAARFFHAASRSVFLETKSKSEKIHRDEEKSKEERIQVVPGTQMRAVDAVVSPNAEIGGFSIELSCGLNDNARRTIHDVTEMMVRVANPFHDNPLVSQVRDEELAMTLTDTASLLSQDGFRSKVDEDKRTSLTSGDLQGSRPTSPQTINHIHYHIIQNSVVTTNSSNLNGITANHGGQNSGASVTQELAP